MARHDKQYDKRFRYWFDSGYRALCLFAERYVGVGAAADIVQDAFVALWESGREFGDESVQAGTQASRQARAFLYVAVRNRCLNYLRDRHLRHEELDAVESDDFFHRTIIEQETARLLHKAIGELSPQGRRVVTMALEGLRNEEIAQRLGVAESTVHSTKKIAYRRLREALRDVYYLLALV